MRLLVFSCASEGSSQGAKRGRLRPWRCLAVPACARSVFMGEIVGVDGVVAQGVRLAAAFRGGTYDGFSPDAESRKKLRIDFQAEQPR